MGTQVVLNLAAKLITESNYGAKVKRIALLDHYWSKNRKDWLPNNYSPGEYAREVLMKQIRDGNDNPPVCTDCTVPALGTCSFIVST